MTQSCQTCKYATYKREEFPCCDCLQRDRWEGRIWSEDIISRRTDDCPLTKMEKKENK